MSAKLIRIIERAGGEVLEDSAGEVAGKFEHRPDAQRAFYDAVENDIDARLPAESNVLYLYEDWEEQS